jgi:hypothetical protein
MKYLQKFESYTITNTDNKNKTDNFYFSTEKFDYKISISEYHDGYYAIGFKAKTFDEYFFDNEIITNENPYKIMDTVLKVAKDFYFKKVKELEDYKKTFNIELDINNYIQGFAFSFTGNKEKNLQRLNLYKRYFDRFGLDVEFFSKEHMYYLQIKKH